MFSTAIDSRDDKFLNVNSDEIFDWTMFAAGTSLRRRCSIGPKNPKRFYANGFALTLEKSGFLKEIGE
jgi:hypothetical protein